MSGDFTRTASPEIKEPLRRTVPQLGTDEGGNGLADAPFELVDPEEVGYLNSHTWLPLFVDAGAITRHSMPSASSWSYSAKPPGPAS